MKRFAFLLLLPLTAWAQYSGPAVDACRAYAERELNKGGAAQKLVIERDRDLVIARYARKSGSQFVGSVLSGNGAIVHATGPGVEFAFVCLLASEKQALFFHWVPRRDAPALAQCKRSAATGDCLQLLLGLAERDLIEAAAFRFQESLEADAKAGNENASNAYRNAAAAWRAYRDAECARRGAAESDAWRGCMVDLTKRRQFDLQ